MVWGLAIVKAIAEAHGGHVELSSEFGHGSTFKIFLTVSTYLTGIFVTVLLP